MFHPRKESVSGAMCLFLCAAITAFLCREVNYIHLTDHQYHNMLIADSSGVDGAPCYDFHITYPMKLQKISSKSRALEPSCRFTPNVLNHFCSLSFPESRCLSEQWYCSPMEYMECNGYSQCLYDECNCAGVDVFFCADTRGCVTLQQVCDVIPDCLDGSDERICPNLQQLEYKNTTIMISEQFYCTFLTSGFTHSFPFEDLYESEFVAPNCTPNCTN